MGTPYSITVDYETLEDKTVTIRDRDSMAQVRAGVDELPDTILALLREELEFGEAGVPLRS